MTRPLRILHVMSSLTQSDGGPIRAVLDLSAAGFDHNIESHMVGPGPLDLPDNPMPLGKIHALKPALFRAYRYAPDLQRWLQGGVSKFDGVVAHGMWLYPGFAAALECWRANIPYV